MQNYRISLEHDVNWNLFVDESPEFACENGGNISNVLRLVKLEFENIFGKDLVDSHTTLAVARTCDCPTTYRAHNLIFLSSSSNYYLQHIFQFSHELCHFMVPSGVCNSLRWFEETLCQAMSWFVLQRIYDKRDASPCQELADLYPNMQRYITNDMDARVSPLGSTLADFIEQHFAHLALKCDNRAINNAIAYEIYPLLLEYPELWAIVTHLHKLDDNMKLSEAIRYLVSASGVEKVGGDQLMQRLSHQGLVVAQCP